MKKWTLAAASLLLALAACGNENSETSNETNESTDEVLTVYTTIYPLQYFTERIGGGTVEVESMLPAGADEHTYEPTSKTMLDIAAADLFLYNGLNLEPFAEKVEETLSAEDVVIVNVGEHVDIEAGHEHSAGEEEHTEDEHDHEAEDDGHDHGGVDPHIWIDPTLAEQMAEVVKEELVALNSDEEALYNENYEALAKELEQLDEDFHTMADGAVQKEILVSHAAYGYWEESYGIEQLSVAGLSPTDEPSQKELKELADTATEHGIRYVIFEQNITPKIAEVIQKEIGAESLRLHNLATLTEEDIEAGEDYMSIMEQNIETLKTAMNK
ncbi:zinc ABC transporter substrate-binding protein [Domibacillus sp. A3M-37]|uniref:metal ABC transporter solute-binding protein, Zn/Mn family n=1 Tax=Domibacillus TaxID=1433999 RepID=UPI0020B83678|nr:zinc ABC transporter substrate-binding protein [Domibacillus sp. A3M-37]MCP3762699.1 zinc ABC transporter substrate-binding protein [Domibacillus sp. A3M-37]